ncbi:conjugal transfer protein TraA [Xylella fastidiosa]|uniref:conjugal transfer protein TraA n=1 Tax=Xylella fastidiosa TaxID=2371 RepID=UPI000FFE9AF0|nr:conjugal transfer protein TraA [Xylella fastidiosa]RWA36897.1 conjugal transfer protein TraA [Xylella fastidiosa subsp. multiplex]
MSTAKSISVWYTEDERIRVEQAAVLSGYKHVSKYIRDKSLDRSGYRESDRNSMEAWADRQELFGRLAEIERNQKGTYGLLAMLFFLVCKKATAGEINELVLICEKVGVPTEMLAATLPELAALLTRFTEDS